MTVNTKQPTPFDAYLVQQLAAAELADDGFVRSVNRAVAQGCGQRRWLRRLIALAALLLGLAPAVMTLSADDTVLWPAPEQIVALLVLAALMGTAWNRADAQIA